MTQARNSKGQFVKLLPGTAITASLTAAAVSVTSAELDRMPRQASGWQERAWRLWRILGVLHYPTSFIAEQVSRVDWNVEVNGEELDEDAAAKAIDAVTQPFGVRETSRRLALNLEVAGEVWFARQADAWGVIAATTPRLADVLRGADVIVHSWLPDPVNPEEPDSPVRAALDVAEEIRLMAALSRAQDRNRIAQRGILLVPKEGQFPDGDPFMPKLEAAMTAPIADEYAASAVVPPVVDFPAELIEKWRHLVLDFPYDDKLLERMDNAIKRLAISLNMPPEALLGNMDSNHFNAWLSEESLYRAHMEPLANLVGMVYAQAMMQAVGGGVSILVTPDPSQLLARRQSVADAFQALQLLVVGFEYVRRQIGADDDDAPTPEEIELILRATGKNAQPAGGTPALGTGQIDNSPPDVPGTMPEPTDGGPSLVAAIPDKRAKALDQLARRLTDIDTRLLSMLEGAAGLAVDAARSKVDGGDVGVQERIAKEMTRLGKLWGREVRNTHKVLRGLGIDTKGPMWEQAAEASEHLLVDGMTAFVAENIERTDSDMPAIPVLLLRQVLATAGGSGLATVAAVRNPSPTFKDPQGFAIGVLVLQDLKDDDVDITQWRFRYGPLTREHPFEEHVAVDGQFCTSDGETSEGWSPGDHNGCLCSLDPVLRRVKQPKPV